MTIQEQLFEFRDEKYAAFQSKLTPNIPADRFIGVRVPLVRKLARQLVYTQEGEAFLQALPHETFDENMLHGLMIAAVKDYERCLNLLEAFLPYVDNWAVCDSMSPKIFRKHKLELLKEIRRWIASTHSYTCRFGMEMLMVHFLDEEFQPEFLELSAAVHSEEYYVNMMIAWFFATALTKQWDAVLPYIRENRLERWTHQKTIQKACESFRITDEQKRLLRTLKR